MKILGTYKSKDKIFSCYQIRQFIMNYRRFRDHIYPHYHSTDDAGP